MFEFQEIEPDEEAQAKLGRLIDLVRKARIQQVFSDPMFPDALSSDEHKAYLETTYLLDTTRYN
jgi:hypothetical protein